MNAQDWDRISDDYYGEILSPIKNSTQNPLLHSINDMPSNYSVVDLGCGLGELTSLLAKKFKTVLGVDFSRKMVDKASEKNRNITNASFMQADMRDLKIFKDRFDVAISINSILAADINDLNNVLRQIYSVIRPGGMLLAIVPSMEVYIYQAMLVIETELKKGKSQKQARRKALHLINEDEHDFLTGSITYDGDTQKCFYRFELLHRLEKAGFKDIKIGKVLYSWKEFSQAGQGYYPEGSLPWDWYVTCKR